MSKQMFDEILFAPPYLRLVSCAHEKSAMIMEYHKKYVPSIVTNTLLLDLQRFQIKFL